jgi:TolB-like protein/tetratricopeptide (TPR) repeat protein
LVSLGGKPHPPNPPCVSAPAKAVFLSYASQDAEAARRLCDALRAVGVEVWFDQSALRGGDAWDASIRRQIKECALFVPVISANTQVREEGYFRREWNLAVNRTLDMADDKAFLLPVVIDATIDVNARVPEKFREVQWTHLPAGEAAAAFAERVQRLLSGGAAVTVPVAPPRVVPLPVFATSATAVAVPAALAPIHDGPSIAVLPFVNRSHDEEDEYFSDGLADELLNVLGKIRGLRVAARSSAFTFKGKGATVAEVGRTLNVATVLEGSARKAGNRMRISVQLVKVADGYQLWSETYDRTLDDIFAVQDDIAQSVVKQLRSALLGVKLDLAASAVVHAEVQAAAKGRGENAEAHRLYLQGRSLVARRTQASVATGIEYYRQAVSLDPDYALAWAALAVAHTIEAGTGGWKPYEEGYRSARQAAERALGLEPDLAQGHIALGLVRVGYDWDWAGANASWSRALELAPGNADVVLAAAHMAGSLGHLDESIALCRRAIVLDPLNARGHRTLGLCSLFAGLLEQAEAALKEAIELSPLEGTTYRLLGEVYMGQGRYPDALAAFKEESHEGFRLLGLSVAYNALGQKKSSATALEQLGELPMHAFLNAQANAYCGNIEQAFEWLDRAYTQRNAGLSQLKVEPLLHNLHGDPRWQLFLKQMGFAG